MTLNEFDAWANSFLKKENFPADPSQNGIQIQNALPDSKLIKKVAFAVDACEATAKAAAAGGADILFVHHGLFWGSSETITGSFYKRVSSFIKNDLALVAYHIPLDANESVGNNYGMAHRLGMKNLEPFGSWRGMYIGVKGELPAPLCADELAKKVLRPGKAPAVIIPLGKKEIKTVGIISGGAGEDVEQAIEQNLDAYITGEIAHEQYHVIEEMGINVVAGGHYETETVGVNLVREKLEKEFGIETMFIDLPTGL